MKNALLKKPLLLLLLGILSLIASAAEPLKVYYFPRPPLYITQADGSAGGFLTEIVKLVFTEAGIEYRFVEMPTLRIENALKGHDYACGIGWFKRPDREVWSAFSAPIYRDLPGIALVNVRKAPPLGARIKLNTLLNSGLLLGVIEGFSYGTSADEAIAQAKPRTFRLVGQQSQLLMMAASGRIDYFLIGLEEASYLLDTNPDLAANLRIIPVQDWAAGNDRYIMFSKAVDEQTIIRVNEAIGKVKKTPAYKKLTNFRSYLKR